MERPGRTIDAKGVRQQAYLFGFHHPDSRFSAGGARALGAGVGYFILPRNNGPWIEHPQPGIGDPFSAPCSSSRGRFQGVGRRTGTQQNRGIKNLYRFPLLNIQKDGVTASATGAGDGYGHQVLPWTAKLYRSRLRRIRLGGLPSGECPGIGADLAFILNFWGIAKRFAGDRFSFQRHRHRILDFDVEILLVRALNRAGGVGERIFAGGELSGLEHALCVNGCIGSPVDQPGSSSWNCGKRERGLILTIDRLVAADIHRHRTGNQYGNRVGYIPARAFGEERNSAGLGECNRREVPAYCTGGSSVYKRPSVGGNSAALFEPQISQPDGFRIAKRSGGLQRNTWRSINLDLFLLDVGLRAYIAGGKPNGILSGLNKPDPDIAAGKPHGGVGKTPFQGVVWRDTPGGVAPLVGVVFKIPNGIGKAGSRWIYDKTEISFGQTHHADVF